MFSKSRKSKKMPSRLPREAGSNQIDPSYIDPPDENQRSSHHTKPSLPYNDASGPSTSQGYSNEPDIISTQVGPKQSGSLHPLYHKKVTPRTDPSRSFEVDLSLSSSSRTSCSSSTHEIPPIPRKAYRSLRSTISPLFASIIQQSKSSESCINEELYEHDGRNQNQIGQRQPDTSGSTERPYYNEILQREIQLGQEILARQQNLANSYEVTSRQGRNISVTQDSQTLGPCSQITSISGSRSQSSYSNIPILLPRQRVTPMPPIHSSPGDGWSKYHKGCRQTESKYYMDWFSIKDSKKRDFPNLTVSCMTRIPIMGRLEFKTITDVIDKSPNQPELIFALGSVLKGALQAKAYRVFRIRKEQPRQLQILHSYCNAQTNEPYIYFEDVELGRMGLHIFSAVHQGVCTTARADNLLLTDPSLTIFYDDTEIVTRALKSAVAVPILNNPKDSEKNIFVIEVWRSRLFTETDNVIASNFMVWSSVAIHNNDKLLEKQEELQLTDLMLNTVKNVFENISLKIVVKRILQDAQKLVNGDRASLFLVDYRNNELVSTVFDLKFNSDDHLEKKEIRMPMTRGIAGYVAHTGESVNIPDAYIDERFNREVDEATGYKTNSILCMPVKIAGSVIAVVQMVNKRGGGVFSPSDETAFKKFAPFFALGLHHARLYDEISQKEQKYRVALEVLSYHSCCPDAEVEELLQLRSHAVEVDLADFYLDPFPLNVVTKCQAAIIMFDDLFDMSHFDTKAVYRFILTVKKNYRVVPYHNFDHGWSVAQTMYAILKKDGSSERFTYKQRLALFVASLCHDLDHRGYTNKYMSETASPLAAIYTTSTLENHHFNTMVTILQHEGHNIFSHFSGEEYKEILGLIRHCILATDLANFFCNLIKMQQLCCEQDFRFNWEVFQHSELAMAISMTASDLSASAKPWDIQNKTVEVIFEEFYGQGDKEKAAGRQPIPMMDRNQPDQQSGSQVQFIKQICLPCYQILRKLLPSTTPLHHMAKQNLRVWVKRSNAVSNATARDIAIQAETKLQALCFTDEPSADSIEADEVEISDDSHNNLNSPSTMNTDDLDM